MSKKDYSSLNKEDLLKIIDKLENKKKYGLVWEEEKLPEKVVVDCKKKLPVLREIKGKEIKKNTTSPINLLIEGDNYHVLSVLNYTHKNKIDVIYIDPPYNTGNAKEWKYNDKYVDENDGYKHSKWLNFMEKRLRLARKLLSSDGVIFISIDEHEFAQLKLLCDKIFNSKNFIGEVIRKTKSMTGDDGTGFNLQHEQLMVYAKDKNKIKFHGERKEYKNYKNPDNDPRGEWVSSDPSAKSGGDGTYFEITNPFTKKKDYPPNGRYWAFSKDTLKKYINDGKISFKKNYKDNERGFIFKRYKNDLTDEFNPVGSLFFINNDFMNQVGTKELKQIFGKEIFKNPKPIKFIKKLLKYSSKPNSIILDFFAGSGTTANAVLDLNNSDNGNRKFILCTNNEGNICEEITLPRIKKIIKGYKFKGKVKETLFEKKINYTLIKKNEKILEKIEKLKLKYKNNYDEFKVEVKNNILKLIAIKNVDDNIKGLPGNLKYFKTAFVKNTLNKDQVKIDITKNCTEMLCIKESIYNLYKESADWKIFEQANNYMAVFYEFENDSIDELKKEMNKIKGKKVLYCFTLDPFGLIKEKFSDWKNIRLEPIPQKILDVYKKLFKDS